MADAYAMLQNLRHGIDQSPRNPGQCILAEFDGEPHPLRAGAIAGFGFNLSFELNIKIHLVGMQNHCILAYYRPEQYSSRIAEYIRNHTSEHFIAKCLERFEMRRVIVYGKVFSTHDPLQKTG